MAFTGGIKFKANSEPVQKENNIEPELIKKIDTGRQIKSMIYKLLKTNFPEMTQEQGIKLTNEIYEIK